MSERSTPPFRADQVGSLIRPAALGGGAQGGRGEEDARAEELRRIQEAAIREVVRLQEEIGLKSITDGEYNRARGSATFSSSSTT